ncbi:MAG: response regulator [Elusimicrobia bacterium]|nr:response regulator [Elusimicrobiota bacterium]
MSINKLKILVVDDEMHARLIIKAYLAPYDVQTFEAKNGRIALDMLKNERYDLVILDYSMPLMGGGDVLKRMQMEENTKNIPVIIYTAGGFDDDMEEWLKTSATAFIEKINLGDDLIPTIRDILGELPIKET